MAQWIIANLLVILNIFMGILVAYLNWTYYCFCKQKYPWSWLKLVKAWLGLAWSLAYIWILLGAEYSDSVIVVRPLIALTLSAMAAGALINYESNESIQRISTWFAHTFINLIRRIR